MQERRCIRTNVHAFEKCNDIPAFSSKCRFLAHADSVDGTLVFSMYDYGVEGHFVRSIGGNSMYKYGSNKEIKKFDIAVQIR